MRRLQPVHRARRLWWSVTPKPPTEEDDQWAERVLGPPLAGLFEQLAPVDRRHSVAVARVVRSEIERQGRDPDAADSRWVTEAALLHDIGKVDAGLRVPGRVAATVLGAALPGRLHRRVGGRLGAYLRYPEAGALRLSAAGADPRVVAWAAEHHLPPGQWSVPWAEGVLLAQADDGADRVSRDR